MLRKPVTEGAAAGGYVLDGFPRTVEQAQAAYAVAKDLGVAVQVAVHLAVEPASLIDRLIARGKESGRTDDTPDVIRHRIEVCSTTDHEPVIVPLVGTRSTQV